MRTRTSQAARRAGRRAHLNPLAPLAAVLGLLLLASAPARAQQVPSPAPAAAPAAAPVPPPAATNPAASQGADGAPEPAGLTFTLRGGKGGYAPALKVLLLLAALSLLPSVVLVMTSFTRIIIVLSMLRQAVGVVQLPPNRVLVGLALFLTAFTMAPVLTRVYDQALAPYEAGELDELEMVSAAMVPLRTFMLHHTREDDLGLFLDMRGGPRPATPDDVPTVTLVPAYLVSELRTAFTMGAQLFIPFLVIDLVVASVLMSMGMMMLPPATISLPLKVIVFVAVDGWGLVIGSLAEGLLG